jgi:hypothetical protein
MMASQQTHWSALVTEPTASEHRRADRPVAGRKARSKRGGEQA